MPVQGDSAPPHPAHHCACFGTPACTTPPSLFLPPSSPPVRKGYHLLAVALFLPALLAEPQLLGVALAAAWAVLLAVEAARLSGLPGICEKKWI